MMSLSTMAKFKKLDLMIKYVKSSKINGVIFLLMLLIILVIFNDTHTANYDVNGWIDSFSDDYINGWVCVRNIDPNRVMLEFSIDNELIAYTQRSYERDDIIKREYDQCISQVHIGFVIHFTPKIGKYLNIKIIDMSSGTTIPYSRFRNVEHKQDGNNYDLVNPLLRYRQTFNIRIDLNQPIAINIIMPSFNKDMTGGPLSILRFANTYCDQFKIRLILTSNEGLSPSSLKQHLLKYNGFDELQQHMTIHRITDGITMNINDRCMATIYYTMYSCERLLKQLDINASDFKKNRRIIYFIQDYEPIFFPKGSNWIEALNSYNTPHYPIFSTPMLFNYFKMKKMQDDTILTGMDLQDDHNYYVAKPAIAISNIDKVSREKIFLVYARPHSDRNAYEFTMLIIKELIDNNILDIEWELIGVGSLPGVNDVVISGRTIHMINNIPEPEYFKLIKKGSLALSIMFSPHPSLPPLDFAKVGMIVITNNHETKNQQEFSKISKNILSVNPNIEDMMNGVKHGMLMTNDYDYRVKHSKLNWPISWTDNQCYGINLKALLTDWMI